MLHLFRGSRGPHRDRAAASYEVLCGCGRALRGVRQERRLIVRCPACGRAIFVLPRSPLASPEDIGAPEAVGWQKPLSGLGPWRLPVMAASITLAVLVVLIAALFPFLGRRAPNAIEEHAAAGDALARMEAGRRAMADGDFHLASQELRAADEQRRRSPGSLSADEGRELTQLRLQSDLLAALSSSSLEEIVREADLVRHEEEWKARFESDYKGKAVLFDDTVRFDGAPTPEGRRRPTLAFYRVAVGGREVRLALEDMNVLQAWVRERPGRMLFGGRLAAVERAPGGQWVVRFDPDGGVLLTDRSAAEAVCPAPLDPELLDVLKRQQEWLKGQTP